jgi:hypothetical protein
MQTIPLQRCPSAQLASSQTQVPSSWQTCPGNPHASVTKSGLVSQRPVAALQV